MTAEQLRQAGKLLFGDDWTTGELVQALDVNRRTAERWIGGKTDIPDWVDDHLRTLLGTRRAAIDGFLTTLH